MKIVRRPLLAEPDALPGSIHPVLRRVYAARDIRSPEQLDLGLAHLLPPGGLSQLEQAAELLATAVTDGQSILVVGDFDADGATSTALCVSVLRAFGVRQVDFLVPNRFEYGYGLTPEIVEVARARSPDLILTVDNGISSVDGVSAARAAGIKVLVTDHHLPGPRLPEADAIVNPQLPDDSFPSKNLAGVGVAFYVLAETRARLARRGWFEIRALKAPNLGAYLDLVALGTVADVVPLDRNNRVLVSAGLQRIRAAGCRPGIRALAEVSGRALGRLVASDLAFFLAPRLNAAGRLDDMSLGIACLLERDEGRARQLALRLDELNRERRAIESEMKRQAIAQVERLGDLDARASEPGELPWGICVFDEDWHPGVVGIVAARVREKYHRPVIAFAPDGDAGLKGSGRSIPDLHLRDTLDSVAAGSNGLLTRFGGHAMAAGLSLRKKDLSAFTSAFDAAVRTRLGEEHLQGVIHSDGELGGVDLGLDTAEAIRTGGPWGQGFPEPVFDGRFQVLSHRVVGEAHLKLLLQSPDGNAVDAIAFNRAGLAEGGLPDHLHLAYRLDVNEFRGQRSPQLIVEHVVQ